MAKERAGTQEEINFPSVLDALAQVAQDRSEPESNLIGGPEDEEAKLKEEEEDQRRANLAKLKKALARKQGILNGVTKRRATKKKENARA